MNKRVLVTRPRADAERMAAMLEARGHIPILAPALEIERIPYLLPSIEPQALILSSRHAAHAAEAYPETPRFVVGRDAPNMRELLVRLRALNPADGPLLYLRGDQVAHDIAAELRAASHTVHESIVYAARPVPALPADAARALEEGAFDIATFFSARTVQAFLRLAPKARVENAAAVAFSAQVAEPLHALPWRSVLVSAQPTLEALLAAVDKAARED